MIRRTLLSGLIALLAPAAFTQMTVDVGSANTQDEIGNKVDSAARSQAQSLARSTARARADLAKTGHFHPSHPLSFPTTVWLEKEGRLLPTTASRAPRTGGLTLVFDSSGSRAFPSAYQAKLQAIFNSAQATLNSVFGSPAVSGNVAVKDYNADISDRAFFSGGLYIPNGSGGPEIHFPEYSDDASTAVNFIHVLLLAYLGPNQYGFDAFSEGLVRAATLQVARNSSALPGYDQNAIADVLENSYDVGPWYDWYNQRALGASRFVAPNLSSQPLDGGIGGIYLMRYRMAGAVWQKVLAEHPTFIANFNSGFYANPGFAGNVSSLITLAQTTLTNIAPSNPLVEGLSFAEWYKRQFILETHDTSGRKLFVQPVPLTSGLQSGDYGPYLIQTIFFTTNTGGNEVLSTATSYPIFWEGDLALTRLFTTAQDERIDIVGSYGAVAPNLPNANGGVPYRATVDIPVQDQMGRAYLPVGSIATSSSQTPSDFYGTVTGVFLQAGDSLKLQVKVGGASIPDVSVTSDGAFGTTLGSGAFLGYNTISVNVVRHNAGGDTLLLSRIVDKGPGALALDLRVASDGTYLWPRPLPKGISALGFPVDPWISYNPDLVGPTALIARYDPASGRYDLFPDAEPFKLGLGYFVRTDNSQVGFSVQGRVNVNIGGTTSLRPGWNLIGNPLTETTQLDHVRVVHTSDFPDFFSNLTGTLIGAEFFEFQPGQNDAVTGAPETGSMIPATTFEPGKAYFVRVLAPEGVSLVFDPQSGTTPAPRFAPRSAGTTAGWLMGVTLIDGSFRVGAQIGESATATRSFDPREDAALPPALTGGRQVVVADTGSMYRDVRALGSPETYTLQLTGLRSGATYRVSFDKIKNGPGLFALYKQNGSLAGYFQPGQQTSIMATGPTMTLRIKVTGGVSR